MISIKGLNKIYTNGTKAVDQLSLEITEGEILALLGPNGAGKSSTIKILTTLSGFDDGEVSIAGYNVDVEPDKVRQSIGYVAQETGVDFFLTGRENLVLQGHLYRLNKKEINLRIEELCEYFELSDALDNLVSSYSGGMRRKLDIATALIHKPKILFLDEPTLGLDTQSRQSLWKYIRKLNGELGLTILLTTHYLEEADKLSNRVAIIDKGQIKVIDKPEALKDQIRGDVVSLQFDKPADKNQIANGLGTNDFVKDSMWEGDKLHLYVSNGATSIPRLIENCNELKADVSNVSYSRPTLDDVFIKYTGSSIDAQEDGGEEKWWEKWAGKGGGGKWAKKWQQENQETDSSDASEWSAEEAAEWHKNKQWSEEDAKSWEDNKQWSAEESAAWHAEKSAPDKQSNDKNEQQWTKEQADQWHKDKQWSEDEKADWENNKQWSAEESAAWHAAQAEQSAEPVEPQDSAKAEKSEDQQQWTDEQTEAWHKNKQWSEEESANWANNKQWSAKEAAAWHANKSASAENQSNEKQADADWSKNNDQAWDKKSQWQGSKK